MENSVPTFPVRSIDDETQSFKQWLITGVLWTYLATWSDNQIQPGFGYTAVVWRHSIVPTLRLLSRGVKAFVMRGPGLAHDMSLEYHGTDVMIPSTKWRESVKSQSFSFSGYYDNP